MHLSRKRASVVAIIVVVVLLAIGVVHSLKKRAAAGAQASAPSSPADEAVIEFTPDDLTAVTRHTLSETLPLTGSLRAVTQAAVKAKVAGSALEVRAREGDTVKAGQILTTIDARDYAARADQSRGQMAAMAGQLDIAKQTLENNRVLVEKGFISKNAFDTAQSQYAIAAANLAAARAALSSSNLSVADTIVRAPFGGQIASRNVEPGEHVAVDAKLFDVVDLTQLELEAPVPVGEIGRVRVDQPVRIRFDGIDSPVSATVTRINPAAQAGSRSIMIYVRVTNPQSTLRVGMFGTGNVIVGSTASAVVVPATSVRTDGPRHSVYAITGGKLVEVPVTTGGTGEADGSSWTELVDSPLKEGQQVVKNNLGALRIGSKVRLVGSDTGAAASSPGTSK
ncbi:efflux RND transporter periplasmic adaptor subunit [Caballeronia sp. dw_276]|jgi:RND family efflux transporter MFP subunit|uniref:efflux RND transporter periplasmic adaptor subunit n=1 Tax=Caballeronia sp. dw_276 TaxID=2719795 RepID=UPI001BD50506|nr:efflux RND transporter periplasmic adaptor subunit [Caballeronia sp. dw_276]